eukprot:952611-Prymnesium_polylepis.1
MPLQKAVESRLLCARVERSRAGHGGGSRWRTKPAATRCGRLALGHFGACVWGSRGDWRCAQHRVWERPP